MSWWCPSVCTYDVLSVHSLTFCVHFKPLKKVRYHFFHEPEVTSVLPRNFITGYNVPGLLKKWGHLRKKRGHCGKNDGTVIWRSKVSFPEIQYINQNSRTPVKTAYQNSGEKQSYFWHGNFPHILQTQSPATDQKSVCARCPAGTVWAASFSKFVRQWRKNAALAEH